MQGKIVCALAIFAIVVIIGPANGCKLCGSHWCSCANSLHAHQAPALLPCPKRWEVAAPPRTLQLTLPVMQPPPLPPCGLPGSLAGLGGLAGLAYLGGLGGGNLCQLCGGNKLVPPKYIPGDDYSGLPRGYSCKCSPRRNRYCYDDY